MTTALPEHVEDSITPGAGNSSPAPVTTLPPCPLNQLPAEVHNYIHSLEERIRVLETVLTQNSERMQGLGQVLFKNPATKMFLAALPKDMQLRLKETFGGENGNKQ